MGLLELVLGFLIVSVLINLLLLVRGMQGQGLRTVVLDNTVLAFAETAWKQILKQRTRQERTAMINAIDAEAQQNRAKRRLEQDPNNTKLNRQLKQADQAYSTALVVYDDAMRTATRRWLQTAVGQKWLDDHGIRQSF